MRNKVVLDTSFLSSLINIDDKNHSLAASIYSTRVANSEIVIPLQSKIELFVMKKEIASLNRILEFLNNFNYKTDYLNSKQEFHLIEFIEKNDPRLKSGDLLILFSAFNNNAELITFDEKLEREFQRIMG